LKRFSTSLLLFGLAIGQGLRLLFLSSPDLALRDKQDTTFEGYKYIPRI